MRKKILKPVRTSLYIQPADYDVIVQDMPETSSLSKWVIYLACIGARHRQKKLYNTNTRKRGKNE